MPSAGGANDEGEGGEGLGSAGGANDEGEGGEGLGSASGANDEDEGGALGHAELGMCRGRTSSAKDKAARQVSGACNSYVGCAKTSMFLPSPCMQYG